MSATLVLASLLSASPLLHVSVERTRDSVVAHLSMRDSDDVELSLYELSPEPAELFAAVGTAAGSPGGSPDRAPHAVPARAPLPLSNLRSGRRALLRSAAELEGGLSKEGARLVKAWLGWDEPVATVLPAVPRAEVETAGTLLRAWRVDAPEPGWNYADVDVGPLSPGLYSLVMRAGAARAEATIAAGELTALCVRNAASLTVLAQERESGIPRAGAEVYAERGEHPVLLGRTGPDGVFTVRSSIVDSIVLRQGKELAFVASPDIVHAGDSDSVGAVFLDRRVAQPGDTIGLWTLFRSVGADGRLALPDSAHAELQLVDREGRTVLRQPLSLSTLGTATAELELPAGLGAGDYTVAVAVGDDRRGADLTLVEGGTPQLTLACEPLELGAGVGARCQAKDGLGRPEPGTAVRWRLDHPLDGPAEAGGAGAAITGGEGEVDIPIAPAPGGQWLRAEATDSFGRSATATLSLPDANPIRLAFRSNRRLLRPGRTATLTLEASRAGEPFRGRVRITATSVRAGPSGEAQASPLFERWLETDPHGRASVSLTASSAGTIELVAATEPAGGSAHATLFVSEAGGDIPATPERLTLIAEVGEHRRGEETRLLVLAPFESGTVLLAFEPPVLATQAVPVRGYSGVVRLTLPAGSAPINAVAAASRGGAVITDRLSLLAARPLPLAVHAVLERPTHPGARPSVGLDTTDDEGHPLASQVTVMASASLAWPSLAELLVRPQSNVAFGGVQTRLDSLAAAPSVEPRTTVPFGPTRAEVEGPPDVGALQTLAAPESGRVAFVPATVGGNAILTLLAAAGPEEIGETRLTLEGSPGSSAAARSAGATFIRQGDEPLDRHGTRVWPAVPADRPLAQAIVDLLEPAAATGPSAELGCAAVRALGALSPLRNAVRGSFARLAQLENLEGGFGESSGEMRRDLAALRGLRAFGTAAESELVTRTRARVGSLADDMDAEDPERSIALAAVSLNGGPEPSAKLGPEELRSASAPAMALWLSAHRPTRSLEQLAGARIRQLVGSSDVLDLAELAVAAEKLSLRLGAASGAPNVARQIFRLQPSPWSQALLDADEEPADPRRVPIASSARVGDELEVQLTAPSVGRGTYCLRDFPPAGAVPEGASSAQATVILCGEPSGGVLQLSYRLRVAAPGRFQMPAPAFGVERPSEGREPEWIEVAP